MLALQTQRLLGQHECGMLPIPPRCVSFLPCRQAVDSADKWHIWWFPASPEKQSSLLFSRQGKGHGQGGCKRGVEVFGRSCRGSHELQILVFSSVSCRRTSRRLCLVFQICTDPNHHNMKLFGLNFLPVLQRFLFFPFPYPIN